MKKTINIVLVGSILGFVLLPAFVLAQSTQEPQTFDAQIQNDVDGNSESSQTGTTTSSDEPQLTAEEIQEQQEVNVNNYLSETVQNEPQTQQELIEQLDVFLNLQFGRQIYGENASVGDLKMVIQDRFIMPKKEINFLVFEQHVDDSYDFSEAEFTWTVKRGFTELFTLTDTDKNTFFYTFDETGSYGVDVVLRFPDGRELSSLMTFTVLDNLTVDYSPFDIGAGDEITVFTERSIPNSTYTWIVDDTEVNSSDSSFTFREFKGQGAEYDIELYVRNNGTGNLTHSGEIQLQVGLPEAWIYLTDIDRGVEIEYAEAIRINQASNLSIQVEPRGFGNEPLEYLFRVNGNDLLTETNEVSLEVDPEQEYEVEVLVRNGDGSKFSVKNFVINKVTEQSVLEANAQAFWEEVRGRYLSLGVFLSIVVIGLIWIRIANI